MTLEQIELARHALGLPNKRNCSYRNRFVTGAGGADFLIWEQMVTNGVARKRKGSALTGGDDLFFLTTVGAIEALKPGEKLDREDFPRTALR